MENQSNETKTPQDQPAAPAPKDSVTAEMQKVVAAMILELKKVIVGKDQVIKKVLMVILAGGHILLEVMEEGGVTVDGVTHKAPEPFVCIATQNPLGSAGTQKLPDSQMDRFMARLSMGYPDIESQVNIVKQRQTSDPIETVRPLVSAPHIKAMKRAVQLVKMSDEIIEYAAALCEKTRTAQAVEQGVSPRAVLALVQMAKAGALLAGRSYAIPQDVKDVFIDVCAHRLILTARAKIRKETEEKVLQDILDQVKPPAVLEGKVK